MKRILASRGLIANSPKEVFRLSAKEKIISDPEIWFDFIRYRNTTVHIYNEIEADYIIEIFPLFSREVRAFIQILCDLA